jgi:hypothetical protein
MQWDTCSGDARLRCSNPWYVVAGCTPESIPSLPPALASGQTRSQETEMPASEDDVLLARVGFVDSFHCGLRWTGVRRV